MNVNIRLMRRYIWSLVLFAGAVAVMGVAWQALLGRSVPAAFVAVPVACASFDMGRRHVALVGSMIVGFAGWGLAALALLVTLAVYGVIGTGALLSQGMTLPWAGALIVPLVFFGVLFLTLIRIALWIGGRAATT